MSPNSDGTHIAQRLKEAWDAHDVEQIMSLHQPDAARHQVANEEREIVAREIEFTAATG